MGTCAFLEKNICLCKDKSSTLNFNQNNEVINLLLNQGSGVINNSQNNLNNINNIKDLSLSQNEIQNSELKCKIIYIKYKINLFNFIAYNIKKKTKTTQCDSNNNPNMSNNLIENKTSNKNLSNMTNVKKELLIPSEIESQKMDNKNENEGKSNVNALVFGKGDFEINKMLLYQKAKTVKYPKKDKKLYKKWLKMIEDYQKKIKKDINEKNNNQENINNIPGFKVLQNVEECQENFIKNVILTNKLCQEFDDDTIEEFAIGFYSVTFIEGQIIYSINTEAKAFYIIQSGKIELNYTENYLENTNNSSNNNKKILSKGDFFGIESFEECSYRKETAICIETASLLFCSGEFYRQAQNYNLLKLVKDKCELFSKIFLFKYIDYNKLMNIAKGLELITYKENSIILNENEKTNRLYIINSGVIRVTRKFKRIKKLETGDFFCHIGLFIKDEPSYYTYSIESEATLYEIPYKIIKELGIKDIIYNIFLNAIQKSEKIQLIFIQNYTSFFNIFKLQYYESNKIVYESDPEKNKKICIIVSGQIRKQNKNDILAKSGDVFGDTIIDSKERLDHDIISDDESLILEAKWENIIENSENDKNNNIDLCETVKKLKRVPIFSMLKETEYLELAKMISKKVYKDLDLISREGEIANNFYIIKSGKVKVFQKKKFVRELEEGGFFGEIPGVTGEIRMFTIQSVGNTECYELTKEDMILLDQNLNLGKQVQNLSYLNDVSVNLSDLFYVKSLGNGTFGKVFLVHNQKHFFAIKFAKIKNICMNKNLMQYYINEKNILLQIDHPFILKLVKTLKNNEYLFFLMEYIDGITLKQHIDKRKKTSAKNQSEAAFYGAILLVVVNYLHNKKILHRDIKPDNCMIDKKGYLKLIDFGVAKILQDKDTTSTLCGTPHYLAPEVILGNGYSYSSDYWSLGITLFEIFYGYVPFGKEAKEAVDVYYEIINKPLCLPYEPKFNEINSLFNILLNKNLMHRVCNYQLLRSHPFFHEFDFEKLLDFSIKAPFIPESYIDKSADNNISMISMCNVTVCHYMNSMRGYDEDNNNAYDEEVRKNIKFIEDF